MFYGELVGGTAHHAADRTWLLRLLLAGLQASPLAAACAAAPRLFVVSSQPFS